MPALRILAEGGGSPKIDVVAVHGLNPKGTPIEAHAWNTWTKPDPKDAKGRLWLRDDLPKTLENARIFLYEYDSRIFSSKHETFLDAGNDLLDRLRGKRRGDPRRPLILIGHSLGGLLIKQALVNAHDNQHYADIEASVKGLVFFGTPHEGGNRSGAKVSIGLTAAKIARKLGFDSNDSIVEVLTPGSLFGDFLRESFRHQLENYFIVSFWEKEGTIVTKESATFGLAGHRETILGLDADHSNMCKFNTKLQVDSDMYEMVQDNIMWLYDEAMKEAALETRLDSLPLSEDHAYKSIGLYPLLQFYKSVSQRMRDLQQTLLAHQSDKSLDWITHTSLYYRWNYPSSSPDKHLPVLGIQTIDPNLIYVALAAHLWRRNVSILDVSRSCPRLPTGWIRSEGTASVLLSLIQQMCLDNGMHEEEFPDFLARNAVFEGKTGKMRLRISAVATLFSHLLDAALPHTHVIFIHNPSSLEDGVITEVAKLLGGLLGTSPARASRLRIAVIGSGPGDIPELSRYMGVIDSETEYLESLASLQFENMNNRRERIVSATIGTNHWIWDNNSYLDWKREESSAIWIAGKPGSGKSVLAKTIQETFLTECETTQAQSLVASWFYSARDNLTLHRQMLSALLHQLLAQEKKLFELMKSTYRSLFIQNNGQVSSFWSVPDLQKAISAIFANPPESSKSCLIIADGLDEGNKDDIGHDSSRRDALRFLLSLKSNALPLKIIFLSRPADDINKILGNQYFISMHHVNRPDIMFLIERGVADLALRLDGYDSDDDDPTSSSSLNIQTSVHDSKRDNSSLTKYFEKAQQEKVKILSDIEEYLKFHAKGVVLWVTTVIGLLKKSCKEEPVYDPKALKRHLEGLPLELSDLYHRIAADLLRGFKGNQMTLQKCRRALMWVSVTTQYSLQLQDLLEVISYDFSVHENTGSTNTLAGFSDWLSFKRSIERLCGPFIEFISADPTTKHGRANARWNTLQLSHETVRTFLQEDYGSLDLKFSATDARKAVQNERRQYMREMTPTLEPMLLSSIYWRSEGREQSLCHYMESHSLISFILLTLSFELQEVIHEPNLRATIAEELRQSTDTTSVFYVFPFLNGASLLRACKFFQFTDPPYPKSLVSHGAGESLLERLFQTACTEGQLNTVNVLLALLVNFSGDKAHAIRGAIQDGFRQAIADLTQSTAAKNQALDGSLFGSSAFHTLQRRWGISFQGTNLIQQSLPSDTDDNSISRRTPFFMAKTLHPVNFFPFPQNVHTRERLERAGVVNEFSETEGFPVRSEED